MDKILVKVRHLACADHDMIHLLNKRRAVLQGHVKAMVINVAVNDA